MNGNHKSKDNKAIIKLIIGDILECLKWFALSMIMLKFVFQANIQEVTGLNIYIFICVYLCSAGLRITISPWLFSKENRKK